MADQIEQYRVAWTVILVDLRRAWFTARESWSFVPDRTVRGWKRLLELSYGEGWKNYDEEKAVGALFDQLYKPTRNRLVEAHQQMFPEKWLKPRKVTHDNSAGSTL